MYKVINPFQDKDGFNYKVGDVFPSEGKDIPDKSRIEVLSTDNNRYKRVFIEEVKEVKAKKKPSKKLEE